MASVSFTGLLVSAETAKASPDKWYLRTRSQHPPWTRHGVARVLIASPSRCARTVTVDPVAAVQFVWYDERSDSVKQATEQDALSLCDTEFVGSGRVLSLCEQWLSRHGGPLHEDDHSMHDDDNKDCNEYGGGPLSIPHMQRHGTHTFAMARSPVGHLADTTFSRGQQSRR